MKPSSSHIGLIALLLVLITIMFALPEPADSLESNVSNGNESEGLALTNARIFDGESVHARATLLIRDGRIEDLVVGPEVPEGFEVIDIGGQTLLPGLIDAHVHSFNAARRDALRFGVTTMLDMFRPPSDMDQIKAQRSSTAPTDRADLFSAGFLATVDGGHGTQYGIEVPTLSAPEEADEWVEARLAEGSDYIKIVIETGAAWGRRMPTLDAATVVALVEAAHARDVMAVAHVSTQAAARMAVAAGVDGLVHLFVDEPINADLVQRLADQEIFVIPTATVLAGSHGHSGQGWLESGANLEGRLSMEQRQTLEQSFPGSALRASRWPMVPASIRALHESGVLLLAGSDAPNPATAHGASLLHEIKLLTESGLSSLEALRSATSIPADRFGLDGRGCLRPGCRADVVWIAGNPLDDIDDLRQIRAVWKNGSRVELGLDTSPSTAATTEVLTLPIDLHVSGDWLASTDEFMGGQSTAEIQRADDGSAVTVSGRLNPGFAFPYAGLMWNPGEELMSVVNLSGAESLSLVLEADSGSYQLMIFSGENAMAPPVRIDLTPNENNLIELGDYSGLDRSRLRAIGIYAIAGEQDYRFTIRGARLQ